MRIPDSREELRNRIAAWKRAEVELEQIRRLELRVTDTAKAVWDLFGDEMPGCLPPARTTSGLVEQQAWFAKLRR